MVLANHNIKYIIPVKVFLTHGMKYIAPVMFWGA